MITPWSIVEMAEVAGPCSAPGERTAAASKAGSSATSHLAVAGLWTAAELARMSGVDAPVKNRDFNNTQEAKITMGSASKEREFVSPDSGAIRRQEQQLAGADGNIIGLGCEFTAVKSAGTTCL